MTREVVYFTDSTAFGGAEQVLLTLLRGLDRSRWRPVLVHHPEPGLAPLLEQARGLDVRLRQVPRTRSAGTAARVGQLVRLIHFLQAERPAVFHANLSWPRACKYGLLAAATARVPAIIAWEHSLGPPSAPRRSIYLQRLISAGVHNYVAVSEALARHLVQLYRLPAKKVRVVHNGLVTEPFARPVNAGLRSRLAGRPARPVVLTTARLDEAKGHRFLLQAACLVPEARFVFAGSGPEREALEAQAQALGLAERVTFLGYRADIPDLLAASDVFVLPSLAESFGLSVLEAMAATRPVVATAVGGLPELVKDDVTGVLVPPADSTALAGAIRALLADPARAQRLAAAGHARVHQDFAADRMVDRITGLYDEMLSKHTSTRQLRPSPGTLSS